MRYLKTRIGIVIDERPALVDRLLQKFSSNPDYDLSLVKEWLIEFGDDDIPWREIGLNANGIPVLAGPDDRNYGFWLDTNMQYTDFDGLPITADEFEKQWNNWTASNKTESQ